MQTTAGEEVKNTVAALVKGNRPARGRQTTELQRKGPEQDKVKAF